MKLLRLKLNSKFRGLPVPFELHFRHNNYLATDIDEPICLVGLNGSGKSNTLEVLCEIFYYLEIKTIAGKKDLSKVEERFKRIGFEIDYMISNLKWKTILNKIKGEAPFSEEAEVIVRCKKIKDKEIQISIESPTTSAIPYILTQDLWGLAYPNKVIGYSSGQNELISNPFIKLDYHYFDEFVKSTSATEVALNTEVNRMFFMDYESNELVVLANYLFHESDLETKSEAKELNKKLRIKHLHSFSLTIQFKNYGGNYVPFPSELNLGIEKLKQCASTYYDNEVELLDQIEIDFARETINESGFRRSRKITDEEIRSLLNNKHLKNRIIELGFYADPIVRKGFRAVFKQPYELFRLLYLFRLMNIHAQKPAIRTLIKTAPQGTNLSDLIPKPAGDNLLFNIDAIRFCKENVKEPVTYKQLSDGEHQLLHVMGTLNLMKENDALFILDEPETHFNPEWRAKMVQLIMNRNTNPAIQQDHFITSHSPFIISDCKPNNVYIFNKTKGDVKVKTAHDNRLNTFGTSVSILTEEVFNKNESQGAYSLSILNEIKNRRLRSISAIQRAKDDARVLGESVEKTLLFRKLIMVEDALLEKEKQAKEQKKPVAARVIPGKRVAKRKSPKTRTRKLLPEKATRKSITQKLVKPHSTQRVEKGIPKKRR